MYWVLRASPANVLVYSRDKGDDSKYLLKHFLLRYFCKQDKDKRNKPHKFLCPGDKIKKILSPGHRLKTKTENSIFIPITNLPNFLI